MSPGISREKGGVQVREMMESSGIRVAVRKSTAGRRPTIIMEHNNSSYCKINGTNS